MSDTDVGGIKGTLSLDLVEQWDPAIAKAKADVAALKASSADVKVTADTDSAQQSLLAVEAAMTALGAETATVNVKVNESTSGSLGTEALVAAQVALTAATDSAAASVDGLAVSDIAATASSDDLVASLIAQATASAAVAASTDGAVADLFAEAVAATAAAEATDILGASELTFAASQSIFSTAAAAATSGVDALTGKLGEAAEGEGSMAAKAALVYAAVSLIGPVSGLAAGAIGGLAAEAGAGVLAVVGISEAMKSGSQTGVEYSDGLKTLKGDLDELGSTAATDMLTSFHAAESKITADMPALNDQVGVFAGLLGKSGNSLLDGLLNGLQVANPLLVEGAEYVNQLAQGIDRWTTDGGLQSFVSYAQKELPHVAQALSAVGTAGVDLVKDMSGTGGSIIDILDGIGDLEKLAGSASSEIDKLDSSIGFLNNAGGQGGGLLTSIISGAKDALNPLDMFNDAMAKGQQVIDHFDGTEASNAAASTLSMQTKAQEASAVQILAGRYGESVQAYQAAEKAAKSQTQQTQASTQAMQMEGDAAGLLTSALDILNTGSLNLAQAQTGMASASNSVTDSMKQNGTAIDGNSEKAVANQQAILASVTAAQQLANAQAAASGSVADGVKSYQASDAALQQSLRSQKLLTPAVQDYINKLFDLNNFKPTLTTPELDTKAADAAIAALKLGITSIPKTHNTDLVAQQAAAVAAVDDLKRDLKTVPASQKSTLEAEIAAAEKNIADLDAKLAAVPRHISTTAYVDTSAANTAMQNLRTELSNISHSAIVSAPQIGPSSAAFLAAGKKSHGGEIAQHFATGGVSGQVWGSAGSGTSDSILTALSIGETVTNSYASSYPGVAPLLSSLNRDPAGTMQALSQGTQQQAAPVVHLHFSANAEWLKDAINIEIDKDNYRSKVQLSNGLQAGTY